MKFTPAKQGKFLAALRAGQSISAACKTADVGRTTVYDLKDSNREFAQNMEDAIMAQSDELIDHARVRALDPNDKAGHTILMFLIRGFRPEFRDNYKTESKVVHEHVQEFTFSQAEVEEAINILTAARGDEEVPEE